MSKKPFDRSQFKKTVSVKELKAQDQAIDKVSGNKDSGYAGYHTIEDGLNRFRIYPGHISDEGKMLPFIMPVQRWWLSVDVENKDEKTGKTETKRVRKRVFDGRVHSSTGKDIVDEYIKFLEATLRKEGATNEEVIEKTLPIYGRYSPVPKERINGIMGKPEWIMFADKIDGAAKTFGKLPIGKAAKIRLEDLISRESADEPLGSDSTNPFTDPDDGRLLEITYNKAATKAADYYKTEIDSSFNKETKMINLSPLSDSDLQKFMEFDSLHKQYNDCYTVEDFQTAIEGLRNLDEENNFGVFQYDEFLDICEAFSKLYPEKGAKAEKKKTEKADGFDFDNMTRNELKIFNRDNNCGMVITTKTSDDDIRDALYDWLEDQNRALAAAEEEVEEEEVEEEIEEEIEEEEEDTTPQARRGAVVVEEDEEEDAAPKVSTKDRLAALKAKAGKKA